MNIAAIVMASGFSKRMEKNKLKLKIDKKNMYEYVLDLIESIDFSQKIVVSNDEEILNYAKGKQFEFFSNPNAAVGKSSSIHIGIEQTKPDTDAYMFFVADQPFLSKNTVEQIVKVYEKNPQNITVPFYDGKRGAPMIFPSLLKSELLELKEDEGGILLLPGRSINKVEIHDLREHFDIDTPNDYEQLS